jgi:hypothetical protein
MKTYQEEREWLEKDLRRKERLASLRERRRKNGPQRSFSTLLV